MEIEFNKCVEDILDIFSKPCDFSQPLKEGEKYVEVHGPISNWASIAVSKTWGYHAIVLQSLSDYFKDGRCVANGGGVILSHTDIMGSTHVIILDGDEFKKLEEYAKEQNFGNDLYKAFVKRTLSIFVKHVMNRKNKDKLQND